MEASHYTYSGETLAVLAHELRALGALCCQEAQDVINERLEVIDKELYFRQGGLDNAY